jgi:hypothetical protein
MTWGEKQVEQQPRGAASEAAARGQHLKQQHGGRRETGSGRGKLGQREDSGAVPENGSNIRGRWQPESAAGAGDRRIDRNQKAHIDMGGRRQRQRRERENEW